VVCQTKNVTVHRGLSRFSRRQGRWVGKVLNCRENGTVPLASRDRASPGHFRAADGGTIFLDEIGEIELPLQAKLLRVLQEQVVTPVGSHGEEPIDVRVQG
jgi:DNA-binding NtrC family response regulator